MKKTIAIIAVVIVAVVAVVFFVKSPSVFTSGKETTDSALPKDTGSVEHLSSVEYKSVDDICKYSSNIVKAKLISVSTFSSSLNEYLFEVVEDYTENTSKNIHVYDAADERYIAGHTYFLFLEGSESALYPHTIYTSVIKKTVIDADIAAAQKTSNGNISIAAEDVPEIAKEAAQKKLLGSKLENKTEISVSTDKAAVAREAEIIAEVTLSDEKNENKYTSVYKVESCKAVKGDESFTVDYISLPPNLKSDTAYYVFFKYDADNEPIKFSRAYPAIEKSELNIEKLI